MPSSTCQFDWLSLQKRQTEPQSLSICKGIQKRTREDNSKSSIACKFIKNSRILHIFTKEKKRKLGIKKEATWACHYQTNSEDNQVETIILTVDPSASGNALYQVLLTKTISYHKYRVTISYQFCKPKHSAIRVAKTIQSRFQDRVAKPKKVPRQRGTLCTVQRKG